MFISVVIPLYNKEPHIKDTIHSVLKQSHQDFEIVVIDDGSTDNSVSVVESITDSRIRLIRQANSGVSTTRNNGVNYAKYDLIAFLDADDTYCPEYLANVVKISKLYPEAKFIGTNYFVKSFGRTVKNESYIKQEYSLINNYFKDSIYTLLFSPTSTAVYKDAFLDVGGYPIDIKRGEDTFFHSKIALKYKIAYNNKHLVTLNFDAVNRSCLNLEIFDFPLREYIKENNIELNEEETYYLNEMVNKNYIGKAMHAIMNLMIDNANYYLSKIDNTVAFKKWFWIFKLAVKIPKPILKVGIDIYYKIDHLPFLKKPKF